MAKEPVKDNAPVVGGGMPGPPGPIGADNLNNALQNSSVVPRELEHIALLVGLGLVCLGLATIWIRGHVTSLEAMATCAGLGITLAVFGGRAGGWVGGMAVAGCAALAVLLYWMIIKVPMQDLRYVRGAIQNVEGIPFVTGRSNTGFLVGRESDDAAKTFTFAIFPDQLAGKTISFSFVSRIDEGAKPVVIDGVESIGSFDIQCIDPAEFRKAMNSGGRVDLRLEPDIDEAGLNKVRVFKLKRTSDDQYIGKFNNPNCDEKAALGSTTFPRLPSFVAAAYAGDNGADGVLGRVQDLNSEDPAIRDNARRLLGQLRDTESLKALSQGWDVKSSTYRDDLGRLVVWKSIIAQDPASAVPIVQSLDAEQSAYLVQMTGMGDFTMRSSATEVLHRLIETTSWPGGPPKDVSDNILKSVISVYENPNKEPVVQKEGVRFDYPNMAYNTTVALGFANCNAAPDFRNETSGALQEFSASYLSGTPNTGKTSKLVADVEQKLKSCGD